MSDLDADAVKIIHRLTRFDHSAYLVGGCVRDLLLDRHPKDYDVATSATPRQIKRLFRNCRIIGRRFRLAHIYFQNGKIIEVATFRATNDVEASAQEVEGADLLIREDNLFGTPEEDALRRDFTINSLFYDVNNGSVLDHADGLNDLRRQVVRTIGDPRIRFSEDPIRILRAIKFAARLDFEIEAETLQALRASRSEIPKAAAPRILEELTRYGREGAARRSFELLKETGVFEVILPELKATYARQPNWELLVKLLGDMDRRPAEGFEVKAGELLAVLLIPALAERLGWDLAGKAERPRGLEIPPLVDETLRPIAVRLRVSRREQERCRQLISLLFRMVPVLKSRRSGRKTLMRRANFDDALWILESLAAALGGDFATAYDDWSAARGRRGAEPRPAPKREHEQERTERTAAPRRRRGRRRPRGGRAAENGQDKIAPAPAPRPSRAPRQKERPRPEKWDDDYFFSALPQAPGEMTEGAGQDGDRYGAADVGNGNAAAQRDPRPDGDPAPAEAAAESAPRPRKRRRRRRRRPAARNGEQSGPANGEAPAARDSHGGSDES